MSPNTSDQDRWLAEAADALAQAERLTGLLALTRPRHDITLAALQSEIMGLRREIERIQLDRGTERRREHHPDWSKFSLWSPVS